MSPQPSKKKKENKTVYGKTEQVLRQPGYLFIDQGNHWAVSYP